MPTQFMAKTWIFVAQLVTFGVLASFSLIFGPLFLFGFMKNANGAPATVGGIALTAMSVPFLLVFGLAVYNFRATRKPVLRLCREGIEVVLIGSSSLDGIPLIPALVHLAWLILSTQGFRQRVIRVPWQSFQDVWVSGPPMARRLTIEVSPSLAAAEGFPRGTFDTDQILLPEVMFSAPLDQIATAIKANANSSMNPEHLASWSGVGSLRHGRFVMQRPTPTGIASGFLTLTVWTLSCLIQVALTLFASLCLVVVLLQIADQGGGLRDIEDRRRVTSEHRFSMCVLFGSLGVLSVIGALRLNRYPRTSPSVRPDLSVSELWDRELDGRS